MKNSSIKINLKKLLTKKYKEHKDHKEHKNKKK